VNRRIQSFRDYFGADIRVHHSSKEVVLSRRPPVAAGFGDQLLFSLRLQLSLRRPQILALQTYYPRTKSRDLLKRVVAVLPRWKLASGL
jgi:hypothetical protein